jgi:phage FluMu protein Com
MAYDIHCKKCGRYLGSCNRDTDITLKCPNCRSLLEYHIMLLWGLEHKPQRTFTNNPLPPDERVT